MSDTPNVNTAEPAPAPAADQAPVETPATNVETPASDTAAQPAPAAAPPEYQQILSKRDADMGAVQQGMNQQAQQAQYQQIAQQQYQQPPAQSNDSAILQQQLQQVQTQQKMDSIQREFDKAAAQHPELMKGSDEYDMGFEDTTWDLYLSALDRGENTSPGEIAAKQKAYAKSVAEKAEATARDAAEKQVQTKQVNTEGGQVASATQDSPGDAVTTARGKLATEGSEDALIGLLRARRDKQ